MKTEKDNDTIYGTVEFCDHDSKYSKEELEFIFKEAIKKKKWLSFKEVLSNGEELMTTIRNALDGTYGKYEIFRYDDYDDWYQECILLTEKHLLKMVDNDFIEECLRKRLILKNESMIKYVDYFNKKGFEVDYRDDIDLYYMQCSSTREYYTKNEMIARYIRETKATPCHNED